MSDKNHDILLFKYIFLSSGTGWSFDVLSWILISEDNLFLHMGVG